MLSNILMVAVGGATGSVFRYLLTDGVRRILGSGFPFGTLLCNVIGCLLIGIVAASIRKPFHYDPQTHLLLMVGILGGFTTFSSYALDTLQLADMQRMDLVVLNFAANNVIGILAVWAAYRLSAPLFSV